MKKRLFRVTLEVDVELAPAVIRRGTSKAFASHVYHLPTPEAVAAHVAFNLTQGAELNQLDGFADVPRSFATVSSPGVIESREVVEPVRKRGRSR